MKDPQDQASARRPRRSIGLLLATLWLATPVGVQGQATIEGTVRIPPPKLPPAAERYGTFKTPVAPPDPLSAIVYLEPETPPPPSPNPPTVELRQQGLQFKPAILAIQKGSTVVFPNEDDEFHNVISLSRAKRLDLGRYRKTEPAPRITFEKEGLVDLHCEIHRHMRGTILVLNTPWFIRTSPDGHFKLTGLPAGRQTLRVFIREGIIWSRPVTLGPDSKLTVSFDGP